MPYTEKQRQWYQANRARIRAKEQEKRAADPEGYRAKRRAYAAKFKADHPEKFTAEARKSDRRDWYQRNKERIRAKVRLKTYGVTSEEYRRMLVAQAGVCAICRKPETATRKGQTKPMELHVDHDHVTGRVRGLLCANCNHLIGKAQESTLILRASAEYLERHQQEKSSG